MANTRKRSDPYQQYLYVNCSAGLGKYMLDVPGPGNNVPFLEDPHIRLQRWGANMTTHTIDVEEDLLGKTRPINYHSMDNDTYQDRAVATQRVEFPSNQPFVEESRASHPAWTYRDVEQNYWSFPLLNPQYAPGDYMPGSFGVGKGIHENISTRLLEVDYYKTAIPVIAPQRRL
jgi:hypothetical protein